MALGDEFGSKAAVIAAPEPMEHFPPEASNAEIITTAEGRFQNANKGANQQLEEAIKGLNNLQAEIASYVSAGEWADRKEIYVELGQSPKNDSKNRSQSINGASPTLGSSVAVIQSLLGDTQDMCSRMVGDNKDSASKLDGELEKCQEEMENLKKELAYATRCVSDLEINMMINGSATESDSEAHAAERELEVTVYRLREENGRLHLQVKALQQEIILLKSRPPLCHPSETSNGHLNGIAEEDETQSCCSDQEKSSMDDNRNHLMMISSKTNSSGYHSNGFLDDSTDSNNSNGTFESSSSPDGAHVQETVSKLQRELALSREALSALKLDRKRLKSEKCELLNQMKEVYSTLEGKERELRDFIRQYEQRMRDSDRGIRELMLEKEKAEEERRKILASVQDSETKVGGLKDGLKTKDEEISKLQLQLKELQGRFVLLTGQQPTLPSSASVQAALNANSSIRTPSVGYGSLPVSPASDTNQGADSNTPSSSSTTLKDNQEPTDPIIVPQASVGESIAAASNKRVVERRISAANNPPPPPEGAGFVEVKMRNKARKHQHRQSASTDRNRLSRLFGIGRSKTRDLSMDADSRTSTSTRRSSAVGLPSTPPDDPIAADLSLAEKAEKLLEARQMSLVRWKQAHLLAWLELELGMTPRHIKAFSENVKSGKVLLSLSDHDLENTLFVVQPLHKKKLRLAIEEYRVPSLCKFPAVREVTWQYVVSHFLPACGLEQFSEKFRVNLVDGRLLNQITKKQLEKYLGVSKKFLQLSLLKGVELLRRFQFDVKALSKRRSDCDRKSTDLLVWSNDRLQKWIEQIDLQEYAHNLQGSGIHGALTVLEPTFSVDTLAEALGIPASRAMVRKHLNAEFTTILLEARSRLGDQAPCTPRSRKTTESGGSLGRAFARSYSPGGFQFGEQEPETPKKRTGFRGSFGKVFGKMRRSTDEDTCSPCRSMTESKSMPENHRTPILSSTPKATRGEQADQEAAGTMSSTTSDLGNSIERSQHMKTILGTPKVLIQPPLTGLGPAPQKSANQHADSLSQSADSAISTDMEHSPPSRVTPACGITIKLRSKSTGRMGLGSGIRPHSIADFSPILKLPNHRAGPANARSTLEPDCPFLLSPERLQNWLSVDDFKSDSNNLAPLPQTPPLERRIGTISEQVETEIEGEMMEHKPIGSTSGIWRGKSPTTEWKSISASPKRKSRPQSLPVNYLDDVQVNGVRGRSRKKKSVGEPPLAKLDLQETDL